MKGTHMLCPFAAAGRVLVRLRSTTARPSRIVCALAFCLLVSTAKAHISGTVFCDSNGNGILDPGEPGIPGVRVTVCSLVKFTDANGFYLFTAADLSTCVPPASQRDPYTARVDVSTVQGDCRIPTCPTTIVIQATPADHVDFCFRPPASIGDFVWEDTNANGIQDTGETGIPGVSVQLMDCVGNVLATTTTDANGLYGFSGLMPGNYNIQVVIPAGYIVSPKDVGSNDAVDSDADATGTMVCTTLVSGENDTTWDAGLVRIPAAIGNFVWQDSNGNGIQDNGESGFPNVTVRLVDCAGHIFASTVTDGSGFYLFGGLAPGNYNVQVVAPSGWAFTSQHTTPNTALDSDADVGGVMACTELSPGETDLSWDAGLVPLPAHLGDYVWHDVNENGIQDSGEPGIAGVTVQLLDCSGVVLSSTSTDANGHYGFDVVPGNYRIRVVPPADFAFTAQDADADDALDSDVNIADGVTVCVTVGPGETNNTLDAGLKFICPASVGLIGGVDLSGIVTDYLFLFANGTKDANWQSASKGYVGNVAVDGVVARERTSGTIAYAGTIVTSDSTLGPWQQIVNSNPGQASASFGNVALVHDLVARLEAAFDYIDALPVTPGFASVAATSLNGLNTQDGIARTYVINVTSGLQVSSKIYITGDAGDVFILRWDTDANPANGYQGTVKFQSGGAIVPRGGLTPGNFVHVAGNLSASGGGSNPPAPYPQGPRLNDGTGPLIGGAADFNGGGFFTGYWLTTGDPVTGETSALSNAIFVGGWYTLTSKFSMTSGTSGVYVSPNCP